MKTMRIFETRGLILILGAVLGVSLSFASPAFAQGFGRPVIVNPDGKVTYLGTLSGDYSVATGINDSGQVVGESGGHAFITGPSGMGMTDLGSLPGGYGSEAYDINDSGQVVGSSSTADSSHHAFITGANGMGMTDLGTFGGGLSVATGINDSGQVVGYRADGVAPWRFSPFMTGPNGMGITELYHTGGNYSVATGINDSGQVVGYNSESGSNFVFITGTNGMGMTYLDTLGGSSSTAYDINDSGQVVGNSNTREVWPGPFGGEVTHAFMTGPNGMGMTDLGKLGGRYSSASGINDSGQVVGESRTANGSTHAFITGPNGVGMTDLNSIADLPGGFYLSGAEGINNLGQVIAVMHPIPEPASYALMLAGLSLVGFMARRKSAAGNTIAHG